MRPEHILPGLRAILTKELVERHGFEKKQVAEILGVSPPAVTLYLQGKRGAEIVRLLSRDKPLKLIKSFADHVADRGGKLLSSELYDLAFDVLTALEAKTVSRGSRREAADSERIRKLLEHLRDRIMVEQRSSEEFMRITSRVKNSLLRMLIRMIGRDCMKHVDMLMLIISMIESGEEMEIDVLDKRLLSELLSAEEKHHIHGLDEVRGLIKHPLIKTLIDSMEADERKHAMILRSLMDYAASLLKKDIELG